MVLNIKIFSLFSAFFTVINSIIFYQNNLCLSNNANHYDSSNRYYDAKLSRFINADPITPTGDGLGLNRYAYVYNNPIEYSDPSGNVPYDVLDDIKSMLRQVDQGLYKITEFASQLATLPDPNLDPLGFHLFALGSVTGGAGGLADDAANLISARNGLQAAQRARKDQFFLDTANRRRARAERIAKVQREVNQNYKSQGHKNSQHAMRAAGRNEAELIDLEQKAARKAVDDVDKLSKDLTGSLTRQIDRPTAAVQALNDIYKASVADEVAKDWVALGDGFEVVPGKITIGVGSKINQAHQIRSFVYVGDGFEFRVNIQVRYKGDDYIKLRQDMWRRGESSLPLDIPKPMSSDDIRSPSGD